MKDQNNVVQQDFIQIGHTKFRRFKNGNFSYKLPDSIPIVFFNQNKFANQQIIDHLDSRIFQHKYLSIEFGHRDRIIIGLYKSQISTIRITPNKLMIQYWFKIFNAISQTNFQRIFFTSKEQIYLNRYGFSFSEILVGKDFKNLQDLLIVDCNITNIQFISYLEIRTICKMNFNGNQIKSLQPFIKFKFQPNQNMSISVLKNPIMQYDKTTRMDLIKIGKNQKSLLRVAQIFEQNNIVSCFNDIRCLAKLRLSQIKIRGNILISYNKKYDLRNKGQPIPCRQFNKYLK